MSYTATKDMRFRFEGLGLAASTGEIPGIFSINKYGQVSDMDEADAKKTLWNGPTDVWVPPTTARIHDIVSTSAQDASGGIGALTVKVLGLDGNYDLAQEVVTLTGTTNVATTNSYTRIFRMIVVTAGSSEANDGDITATARTDGTVSAKIGSGESQTLMAIYTVPAGHTAFLTNIYATFNRSQLGAAKVYVDLKQRESIDSNPVVKLKSRDSLSISGVANLQRPYFPYREFVEKSDIFMEVSGATSDDSEITGGFDLIIVRNTV